MNYLFRSVFNVNHFLGKKRFLIAFITTMMLFNFNSVKAQSLVDNVTVNLTDVTWNLYCADGTDFGTPIGCVGNNGPDPRFRFRVGWDGGNFSTYRHVGASNSPETGGPTLDDESDTDGATINSINFRTEFSNQCVSTIEFDLDAWDEDIGNFSSSDCPSDGNYVYNNSYSALCTVGGDGDDSRATTAEVYNIPNSNGSEDVVYNFGSFSMTFNIARTIVAAPTVTTVPVDRLVCLGGTVTLSSSAPGSGNNIEWFTNPANPAGSVLGSGETYTTAPIVSFPFEIYCAEENGGCYGEFTLITIDERGAIDAPSAAGTTICNGASATLTAVSGGTPGVIYWYSDPALTNLAFIGNPYTTPALTSTTTYYLVEESLGCVSPSSSVTVTVDPAIVDVVGTGATICTGQTATLTAVGTGSLEWYSDGAGVNLVGTGGSYETPVLAQTTTFFVTQTSGSCAGNLVPVTAIVSSPVEVENSPITICQGDTNTIELEASNVNCTGGFAPVADFTGSLTLASPTFVRGVAGFVYSASGVGTNVFYNTHTFQVSADGNYDFELCGITNFVDNFIHLYQNSFDPNSPAVNFLEARDDGATCYGAAAPLSVNLTAGVTYVLVATTFSNGDVDDYEITFTGPGQVLGDNGSGDVVWFDAPVGGTQIGTGSPFNPVGVLGSGLPDTETPGTYTFYVACSSNPDCRAEATIEILALPAAPIVSGDTEICSGESTLLTAVGAGDITWYSDIALTTVVSTGAQYNTGTLNATTSYWVTATDGDCEGEATLVEVIVIDLPAAPIADDVTICQGETATLNAVAVGDIEWYSDGSGINLVGTGASYETPALQQTTTFFVGVNSGICSSNLVPVTVNVTLPPVVANSPFEVCQGDTSAIELEASSVGCTGGFAPVTDFTGAITLGSPTFNRSVSGTIYIASGVGTDVFYNTHSFQVTADGVYDFEMCGTTNFVDTYLHLYQNGFNPGTPEINFVQANDDGAACYGLASLMSVNLTAGIDYIMIATTFANGDVDDYEITFTGPGQVLGDNGSGDVVWFDAPVGGTQIGTGSPFNPVGVLGSGLPDTETPGTYTFYVACSSNPDCRAEATIEILALPAAPIVSGDTEICSGESTLLTAVGAGDITWYSDVDLTTVISTGAQYNTGALNATTSYWVTATDGDCEGDATLVEVVVNELPVSPVADDLEICEGQSASLTATVINGEEISWYGDASGNVVLATGDTYNTPILYQTTTYYVGATNEVTGCESELTQVQAIVNPLPNAPQAADITLCIDETGDITATGSGVGTLIFYDNTFTQIGSVAMPPAEGSVTVGPFAVAGTYLFYVAENDGDCESELTEIEVVVGDTPGAPTISGDTEICSGESTVLTAVGSGGSINWYGDAGLTVLLSTGSQYNTGVLTGDITYWATESFGSCEGESASVTVTVNDLPAAPVVTGDTVCVGEMATLSAVGSGGTFEWFTDASGNVSVGSGDSYMTPELNQTTTYYTQETSAEGCLGPITPVTAVVLPQPAAPVVVPVVEFCEAESYIITATVGLDAIGSTLESTLTNDQGDVIDAQSNLITGITTDITFVGLTPGVYSHFVTVNDGDCESLPTEQTIVINENPDAPLVLESVTICSGETATLFAFGQNANPNSIITWYDETILNPLAVGWEYETQPLFLDQVFYASITDENGCESELSQILVIVNNNPTDIVVVNDTVCEGDMATLSVSGDDGSTFTWFTDGAGANQVATGTSYITPALAQTTTYYVAETNANNCDGQIVGVTAYVVPAPAAPQTANIILCVGETGQLTATGSGAGQLIWYDGAQVQLEVDNMPPATGSLEVGPFAVAGTYFFYVSESDGNCESELVEIEVLVGEAPGAPTASADTICAGETATLTAVGSGGLLNWYSDVALTNLVGVGPQFITLALNATTSYWVAESFGSCEGVAVEVEVVVNPLPETPQVSANTPCEGGTLQLTASNAFGVTYQWNGPSGFSSNLQNPSIVDVTEANNQGVYTLTITNNATGCVSEVASVVVDIVPIPESPSISNNGPICEGEDLVLTAGLIEGATYTWYDSDNNVIAVTAENTLTISPATLDDAGIYGVSVTVSGCTSGISTTNVKINATPATPAVSNNGPICENGQLLLITNVVAGATYVWEGPNGVISQTGPIVSIDPAGVNDAGTYSVFIVVNGCPSEAGTTEVIITPAPVLTQNPTTNSPVCEHDTILLQAPYDSTLTYVWSGPNGYVADTTYIDTVNNFYVEAIFDASESDDQGFYTLVVTDTESGCSSTEYAVLVIVNKFPDAILADNDGPVCEGEDVQLTATGIFGAEYVWTGPDNFYSTEQNPIVENVDPDVNAGTYEVTIVLGGCVSQSATTDVLIYRNPIADAGEDLTILEGTIFQLDGLGSIDAIDFAWVGEDQSYFDDPTRPNPIIGLNGPLPARDEPYVFVLTVYSEFGCTDSDTVLVYVYKTDDLIIPNVITPNGDGANDTWVITYLENLSDYVLSIYARGGSLVYKTTNYNNDWSGVGIKGDDLPAGTYWYSIHGTDTNQEEITFKGYIEIVR
jgi:gliding motility-associated-like protein